MVASAGSTYVVPGVESASKVQYACGEKRGAGGAAGGRWRLLCAALCVWLGFQSGNLPLLPPPPSPSPWTAVTFAAPAIVTVSTLSSVSTVSTVSLFQPTFQEHKTFYALAV